MNINLEAPSNWKNLVIESKNNHENFNDFSEDRAVMWADEQIKKLSVLVSQCQWVNIDSTGEFPDLKIEEMKVIAHWSDGTVEISTFFWGLGGEACFQRSCGTNEDCEGLSGNVGRVLDWMYCSSLPEAPKPNS